MFFEKKYNVVNTNDLVKRAMEISSAKKNAGTAKATNNTGLTTADARAEKFASQKSAAPVQNAVINPNAALDQLRKNVLAGNVPNSGSGIIPTTQQKATDFSGSAITSNNAVLSDVSKLSPSGVTYTKPEEKSTTSGTQNAGAKKENGIKGMNEGKSEYATEPVATPNPEDYGFSMGDFEGFSYGDFQVSDAYKQAMEYTNSLLSQLTSGRTSYTDQINALMGEYQNRDKFSYDASTDAMFQQMLASSMNSGKMAMQDTIGQAAALTGGYGNTYGTAAGNAAYNQYISDAYSNLPEYYGMALDAYNMEGDQMLSELAMLRDADSAEYSRLVDSYRASLDAANTMYDREYTQYIDDRNAAESEYWDDLNFRYGAYIDALNQANKDRDFNYGAEQDRLDREERSDEREYQRGLDKAEWDYKVATDALSALGGADGDDTEYKTPSEKMYAAGLEAAIEGGEGGFLSYADTIPGYDADEIGAQVQGLLTFTKTDETKNGFWGLDHNDGFTDGYGTTMTLDQISDKYGLSKEQLKQLTKLKKGETVNLSGLDILQFLQ